VDEAASQYAQQIAADEIGRASEWPHVRGQVDHVGTNGSIGESGKRQLAADTGSAACGFPMQALAAVNDVLFERHGYRRMARHGDPRCGAPTLTLGAPIDKP
jgi:hypothetical protein